MTRIPKNNHSGILVLRPVDIAGFSVAVVFCSKAQCAGNGCVSLPKCCNAAAGCNGDALWVNLSMPMDCVVPLDKGAAIAGEARLAMNIDKLTEPDNINWTKY